MLKREVPRERGVWRRLLALSLLVALAASAVTLGRRLERADLAASLLWRGDR